MEQLRYVIRIRRVVLWSVLVESHVPPYSRSHGGQGHVLWSAELNASRKLGLDMISFLFHSHELIDAIHCCFADVIE